MQHPNAMASGRRLNAVHESSIDATNAIGINAGIVNPVCQILTDRQLIFLIPHPQRVGGLRGTAQTPECACTLPHYLPTKPWAQKEAHSLNQEVYTCWRCD